MSIEGVVKMAGFFSLLFGSKDEREQQRQIKKAQEQTDRETIRNSAKTQALVDTIIQTFKNREFDEYFYNKQLYYNYIWLIVSKDGVWFNAWFKQAEFHLQTIWIIKFEQLGWQRLKSNAMSDELTKIIVEEIKESGYEIVYDNDQIKIYPPKLQKW